VELYVLSRHGESTLNSQNRINGDPAVPVALTEKGRQEARSLGRQIAHLGLDLCICTQFSRTRETAEIALGGRDVPIEVEPLLDDIDVGDLEGLPLEDYRAWKREHSRSDPFPGGESLDAAALRYAKAFRKLLERSEESIFVVSHEIPLRYAINAADGSDSLDGPAHQLENATPYLFDQDALSRAVVGIERLA
jgi:probable phosphoglycerate mutase